MKTYTGIFHKEGDTWVAEVKEVPQAHTYGRTLAKTQVYLKEALALVLDVEEDTFELLTQVHTTNTIDALLEEALVTRQQAELVSEKAKIATTNAAVALVEKGGLSLRDAAVALDLSYQRINQILEKSKRLAS